MTLRRRLASAGAALLAFALIAGCGGSTGGGDSGGGAGAAPDGAPKRGGSATFLVIQNIATLDPATADANSANGVPSSAVYGQLLIADPTTGAITPRLAESFTTEDGLTWTLKLRPGLTFTDGTPFDAAAVDYAWSRYADTSIQSEAGRGTAASIASRKVVDDLTLQVQLTSPNRQFDKAVAPSSMIFIGSPTALKAGPAAFAAHPIGAGPFTVESWAPGAQIVFKRNPGYFDPEKPYLDELIVRTVTDPQQRLQSVTSGDADLEVDLNPDLGRQGKEQGLVVTQVSSGTSVMQLNTRVAPFDDVRARRAVSMAIDLDALNQAVYGGSGTVPNTQFPQSSPFYVAEPQLYHHDAVEAQRLFDELAAEGKPVDFTMLTFPTDARRVFEAIQAQLTGFKNLTAKVEVLDAAAIFARLGQHDFQAASFAISGTDPEPTFYQAFGSDSKRNYTGVSDPALDAALLTGRNPASQPDRIAAYQDAQKWLAENVPYVPYTRFVTELISGPTIGGASITGTLVPSVETLWRSDQKS